MRERCWDDFRVGESISWLLGKAEQGCECTGMVLALGFVFLLSDLDLNNTTGRRGSCSLRFSSLCFLYQPPSAGLGRTKGGLLILLFPSSDLFFLVAKSCRSCCCCPVPALAAQQFLEQAKGKQQPLPCIQLRFPSPSLLSSQWHRNGGQNLGTALRDCRYGKITAFLPWISGGGFP